MKEPMQGIDTLHTRVPVCPHCGHEDIEWWDCRASRGEGWDSYCGSCEKVYRVSKMMSVSFATKKLTPCEVE
jgi:hypothetical protein